MAKTIAIKLGYDNLPKGNWFSIVNDLKKEGGLTVTIDPLSVSIKDNTRRGQTAAGTKFHVLWGDNFLKLSMDQYEEALVKAFSKTVGYQPYCQYIKEGKWITFEWDKKDPEGSYNLLAKLQKVGVKELQRL